MVGTASEAAKTDKHDPPCSIGSRQGCSCRYGVRYRREMRTFSVKVTVSEP